MAEQDLSKNTLKTILKLQKNEVKGYLVYGNIANRIKDEENKKVLLQIANDEKAHAEVWEKVTGISVKVSPITVWFYSILSVILGFTFTIKFMERGEFSDNKAYLNISKEFPQAKQIALDEEKHERELMSLLDEERLHYVGSMVLGLNDALVELTGTLAGLTFALGNNKLVALSGLITGVSATLSM
ncbi:MAG: VIT1/CCC1 family protein, partial [Oscillospiraceae bacterium]